MCKGYVYHTLCSNQTCETIVGSKTRNSYCRKALESHRLGHCKTGVQVTQRFFNRDNAVRCGYCKSLSLPQSRMTKSTSSSSGPLNTAGSRRRRKKAYDIFEHVFEFALETEVRKERHDEPQWAPERAEPYSMQSPEDLQKQNQGKRHTKTKSDRSKESSGFAEESGILADPYGLQQSYESNT